MSTMPLPTWKQASAYPDFVEDNPTHIPALIVVAQRLIRQHLNVRDDNACKLVFALTPKLLVRQSVFIQKLCCLFGTLFIVTAFVIAYNYMFPKIDPLTDWYLWLTASVIVLVTYRLFGVICRLYFTQYLGLAKEDTVKGSIETEDELILKFSAVYHLFRKLDQQISNIVDTETLLAAVDKTLHKYGKMIDEAEPEFRPGIREDLSAFVDYLIMLNIPDMPPAFSDSERAREIYERAFKYPKDSAKTKLNPELQEA